MYCQKCRTPLRLHGSLENLNSAAFHLLADAPTASDTKSTTLHQESSQPLYSPAQKQLYENAAKTSPSNPIFTLTVPPSRHNQPPDQASANGSKDGRPYSQQDASTSESAKPSPLPKDHSAMSFVDITQSQVVPPSVAQKANSQRTINQPTDTRRKAPKQVNNGSPNNIEHNKSITQTDPTRLSNRMETSTTLFQILSSRSDIDHPICAECTDLLTEGMERRLADATRERDAYIEFLQNAQADAPTDEEAAQVQHELEAVREKEGAAMRELEELEAQKTALEREIAGLDSEAAKLDREEEAFWRERNGFAQELRLFQDKRDSLNLRYDHDARQLERLQRSNVYNDTFNISHDGVFGTINGLRLGRMPGSSSGAGGPVEWAEVNAAWGQACLLLDTIARRLGFAFQGYRLHPMGSTSSIEKFDQPPPPSQSRPQGSRRSGGGGPVASASNTGRGQARQSASNHQTENSNTGTSTSLPLHYTSDLPISLGFLHRNFDSAMTAFVECIRQIGSHIELNTSTADGATGRDSGGGNRPGAGLLGAKAKTSEPLKLPYTVTKEGGKIHDVSIKLSSRPRGAAGDEQWTRACKYVLTCLKFLLAVGSDVEESR